MITPTSDDKKPPTWYYFPRPGAGRLTRNGFTGYSGQSASALADAVGLRLVILEAADGSTPGGL